MHFATPNAMSLELVSARAFPCGYGTYFRAAIIPRSHVRVLPKSLYRNDLPFRVLATARRPICSWEMRFPVFEIGATWPARIKPPRIFRRPTKRHV